VRLAPALLLAVACVPEIDLPDADVCLDSCADVAQECMLDGPVMGVVCADNGTCMAGCLSEWNDCVVECVRELREGVEDLGE